MGAPKKTSISDYASVCVCWGGGATCNLSLSLAKFQTPVLVVTLEKENNDDIDNNYNSHDNLRQHRRHYHHYKVTNLLKVQTLNTKLCASFSVQDAGSNILVYGQHRGAASRSSS